MFFANPKKYAHQIGSSPRNLIWNDLLMKILWQIHRKTQKAPPFWACLHCIWISPDRPADSSWSPFCNFQGSVFESFFHLSDNQNAQRKETNSLPKFNSSPLKSYRAPIGKDRLPTSIFQWLLLLNFGGVGVNNVSVANSYAFTSKSYSSGKSWKQEAARGLATCTANRLGFLWYPNVWRFPFR